MPPCAKWCLILLQVYSVVYVRNMNSVMQMNQMQQETDTSVVGAGHPSEAELNRLSKTCVKTYQRDRPKYTDDGCGFASFDEDFKIL